MNDEMDRTLRSIAESAGQAAFALIVIAALAFFCSLRYCIGG